MICLRACLLALLGVFAARAAAEDAPRLIRVLIVDGFSNHDWRLTTRSIRAILAPTGLFSVDVSTSPPDAAASGWGQDTGHGKRFDALVQRRGEHPVHAGLPRAWLAADIEVYYHVRGPAKNVEVLSFAREPHTAMNWPIEWTVRYGRGRVYTSTLGHVWRGDVQPVTVRDAGVQTLLVRSLQWLARRPATWPVPGDFPTATSTSVRGELRLPD